MPIQLATPAKNFQFVVEIDAVDQFEIQTVEPPVIDVDTAEHGGGVFKVKTAGMANAGDATLETIKLASTGSVAWWQWLMTAVDPVSGTAGLATTYKRNIVIREVVGGVTISREMWEGCFVKSYDRGKKDRLSSDNTLAKVVLSVDRVRPL